MGSDTANGPEHLTERQKKWFASVREGLARDTGKSLEEWVAIAQACPETAPRARLTDGRQRAARAPYTAIRIMAARRSPVVPSPMRFIT